MKNRISIVAYLNVVVVFIIGLAHEHIEELSYWVLFYVLLIYAFANGIYIQHEIRKQEQLAIVLKNEKKLKSDILKLMPTGIIITGSNGIIKFMNPSAKQSFSRRATEVVDINKVGILNDSGLNKMIYKERVNQTTYLHEFPYSNEESKEEGHYNISMIPFVFEEDRDIMSNMIVFENVSDEVTIQMD